MPRFDLFLAFGDLSWMMITLSQDDPVVAPLQAGKLFRAGADGSIGGSLSDLKSCKHACIEDNIGNLHHEHPHPLGSGLLGWVAQTRICNAGTRLKGLRLYSRVEHSTI